MTRGWRRWLPWLVLIVAATGISVLLATTRDGEPLSPTNQGPDGAQGLAEVLRQQGVEVQVVNGTEGLARAGVGPGTTVLLGHTAYLGPDSGAELVRLTREAQRLVVLVPQAGAPVGDVLGLDVQTDQSSGPPAEAECTDPLVRDGDRVTRHDVQLSATGSDRGQVTACFPPAPGHNAGGARDGAMLTFPATQERAGTTLVGFPAAWTNRHITEEANAALGLRLLGGGQRLVWVIPQPTDAAPTEARSLGDVLPRNFAPSVLLLAMTALALAVWRGRRLGPVVTEPLPAVVHASETTRSRGRLYRQADDREHALAAAQAGTRHRLAPRLGLPRTVGEVVLVAAVVEATGRPEHEITRLLTVPTVDDDETFVTTVRELRSLEEGLHP